jgi:hypothetical protein
MAETYRKAERPYVCCSRLSQPKENFWASEDGSSDDMTRAAWVGRKTDIACVP